MLGWRALTVTLLLGAPLQCPSRATADRAREDGADEALWHLAERFGREGYDAARRETLREIVERYPSSRFRASAEVALDASTPTDAAR